MNKDTPLVLAAATYSNRDDAVKTSARGPPVAGDDLRNRQDLPAQPVPTSSASVD